MRPDERHRVVGGNAQIRRKVQCGRQAQNHDCDQQDHHAQPERCVGHEPFAQALREFHDIAEQKQVDKGGDPDFFAVKNQRKQQQNDVHDDIQRAEADRDHRVQAAHQRLKRVDTECGKLEHAHTDAADDDAEHAHDDSFYHLIHFFGSSVSIIQYSNALITVVLPFCMRCGMSMP